jgi:hypothetical protein
MVLAGISVDIILLLLAVVFIAWGLFKEEVNSCLIPIRHDVTIYGKDCVGMGGKHGRKTSRDSVGRAGYPRGPAGTVPETRGR